MFKHEQGLLEIYVHNIVPEEVLSPKSDLERSYQTVAPALIGKLAQWANQYSFLQKVPGGSRLHKAIKNQESSPWRLLAEKVLSRRLEHGFSSSISVNGISEITDEVINAAYDEVFIDPKIFIKDDGTSVVDFAYKIFADCKKPQISTLEGAENNNIFHVKRPLIIKLEEVDLDQTNIVETQKKLKKIIKKSPFVIVHSPGKDNTTDLTIYSSHLPLDGVTAAALLQFYARAMITKQDHNDSGASVIHTGDLSDEVIKQKLEFTDAIETDGEVVAQSMLISGEDFENLHLEYRTLKVMYDQQGIILPENVYYWLNILSSIGVNGEDIKAANLRFSEKIDTQLSLFDLGNAKQVLQYLRDYNLEELEKLGYLTTDKKGNKRIGFTRKDDIVAQVVKPLTKALPAVGYDGAWRISEIIGLVKALIPNVHISTIPTEISLPGGIKLVVDGLASTALSDHEDLALVMMLYENKLIIRVKYRDKSKKKN